MSYLRKSVSILLVFMMIVSLFTIVPITASAASGDRVQLFARKWIKADVVEGKYYKLDDLYANFILFRTDPNQTFDNTFESTAIWNKTGDLALSNGHNKITVYTFDDSNLGAYWGNDDSREGIYLSDELNSAAADWYVYTWEVFNGTLTEAQAAACTDKGNVEYYTAVDRYFVPVYNEGGEKVYDGDSLTVTQVPQEQTEIPAAGHSLTHHEANAATLDAAGNSEYWECSVCGKYFSDANAAEEIEKDSWIIPAKGSHTWNTDEAVWDEAPVYYQDADNNNADAYKANVTVSCADCSETKTLEANTSGRMSAIEKIDPCCEEDGCTKVTVYASIDDMEISHTYQIDPVPASHELTHVAAAAATATTDGNIEYWQCSVCHKYFSDAEGKNEITQAETVIPASGVASVNGTGYPTFAAAAAARTSYNDVITLLENIDDAYTMEADEMLKIAKNGKTITVNPPEGDYLLDEATNDGVTTYTVEAALFSLTVGDSTVKYATLAGAVSAAPADGTAATVTPLGSYAVNGFTTAAGQNITFAMNGKRVNLLTPAQITAGSTVTLNSPGMLGIDGNVVDTELINNYGTLNINGAQLLGTVTGKSGSTTTVSKGTQYMNLVGESGAAVNIAGNTSSPRFNAGYGAVTAQAGSAFTVTGGDMRIDFNVADGANVAISGGYFKTKPQQAWCAEGYVPTLRSAATGTSPYSVVKADDAWAKLVTADGEEYYYTQYQVQNYSSDGDTLVLLKDHAAKSLSIEYTDKKVTVDLNGFSLKGMTVGYGDVTVTNGTILNDIDLYAQVENSGKVSNLTIGEGCTANGGIILWSETDNNTNTGYDATLNVDGTVNNGIFVHGTLHEGNSVVNVRDGGTVNGGSEVGIAVNGKATVNVEEGAAVTGITGIEVRAGELNVTGGTVTGGTGTPEYQAKDSGTTTKNAGIAVAQHGTQLPITVNVTGGKVTGGSALYIVNPQGNTDTTNPIIVNVSEEPVLNGTTVTADTRAVLNITGGTFYENPQDRLPEGYMVVVGEDEQGVTTYTVVPAVASVNGESYASFTAAAEARASNSDVITLLKDIEDAYTITAGDTLKVDKNGKTLTVNAPESCILSEETADGVTTYTTIQALAKVGEALYDNLDAAVAAAISTGEDIYLLTDCNKAPNNAFSGLTVTDTTTFKVHANGFYGASFAAKTDIATGAYVNTWTISGSGKKAVYTYTIKAATVSVERADGTIIYPTALYQSLSGMDKDCAQQGETVHVLSDIELGSDKALIKVKYSDVTLDLGGKAVTGVKENFLEVKDGNTLTVKDGTIGGEGNIKVGEGSTLALDNATVGNLYAGAGAVITFANGAGVSGDITVPEDYKVVTDPTTGVKTVVPMEYTVQNTDTGARYESPEDALAAAQNGETLQLLTNINTTGLSLSATP